MRLRHVAVPAAVAVVVAITLGASPAQANHSWGGYHWSRSGAVTVPLVSSLTSGWAGNLAKASNDWNKSPYIESSIQSGSTTKQARHRCAMTLGQIHVCNYAYGNNGWAGLATISLVGGTKHISKGSVKLNDTYESGAPAAERQGVTCQEVGHTYGLDHQDTNFDNPNLGTCMDYTRDWSTNQHPNQHDYDELALIYSHNDGAAATKHGVSKIKTGNTVTMITWAD